MPYGDVLAFVSVALGVGSPIGYIVGVKIEQRRDKAKADNDLKQALFNDILNHLNHARTCIAEFKRVTTLLATHRKDRVEVNPNILESFITYITNMLEGIQKHTDINNLDKSVFTPLAHRMHPLISTIQDFHADGVQSCYYGDEVQITRTLVDSMFQLDDMLITMKRCVDQAMPGWKNVI